MSTILKVRQGNTDFYVLAEKNSFSTDKTFVNFSTNQEFSASELSYALTKLHAGKPKTFIGYVEDITPRLSYTLRIPVEPSVKKSDVREYTRERLHILEKVYELN